MANEPADLADLRHDVLAKCANFKTAVVQLRGDGTKADLELLRLMDEQARALANHIAAYSAKQRGGRRR